MTLYHNYVLSAPLIHGFEVLLITVDDDMGALKPILEFRVS